MVLYGDNLNDIPMFLIANRCYVMDNADKKLKDIATSVIGNNNENAVVKFLLQDVQNG